MSKCTILVVDDEPDLLQLLKRTLEPDLDCKVKTATSGKDALEILGEGPVDLVLADIRMPGMDGLELLGLIKRERPDQTVVMMTGHGSIETAVFAMKNGAYDFVTKPFDHDAILVRLEKALERSSLVRENRRLMDACQASDGLFGLAGKSSAMQRVFETIRMVAPTDLTVLITGESGTGKDLTARAVHGLSKRAGGPFVAVNCPTVPENILESELFGYRKGAFTGAVQNRTGLFQEASGGTIFLDEIGDVSPAIQTKLLRVVQEKQIKPLGDNRTMEVDVRILASTNRNLKEKIRKGEFREDLFYRLNVLPIHLPPLRERMEDLGLLCARLLEIHCIRMDKPIKRLSPKLLSSLQKRTFEGNVRELENLLIQGILFSAGDEITPSDMGQAEETVRTGETLASLAALSYKDAKEKALQSFNESYIEAILDKADGNVSRAALLCGLPRQSLQQIMRRFRIRRESID